jgi:type IV fimbrial biogenesis protein FimT
MPPLTPQNIPREQAFSLIEVMVVVAILAILTTIGAPAYRDMIENQRARDAASALHASMILARSEAMKRNISVTVTPNNADNWANGWQIENPNIVGTIESQPALSNLTILGPANVIYRSSGRTQASASFTATSGSHNRCVDVDISGRPAVKPC